MLLRGPNGAGVIVREAGGIHGVNASRIPRFTCCIFLSSVIRSYLGQWKNDQMGFVSHLFSCSLAGREEKIKVTRLICPPKGVDLLAVKVCEAAGNFQSGEKNKNSRGFCLELKTCTRRLEAGGSSFCTNFLMLLQSQNVSLPGQMGHLAWESDPALQSKR